MKRTMVKEIADATGLHPNTIRNWTDKGVLFCYRTYNGVRWFSDKERTIKHVKQLLGLQS